MLDNLLILTSTIMHLFWSFFIIKIQRLDGEIIMVICLYLWVLLLKLQRECVWSQVVLFVRLGSGDKVLFKVVVTFHDLVILRIGFEIIAIVEDLHFRKMDCFLLSNPQWELAIRSRITVAQDFINRLIVSEQELRGG